MSTSPAPVPPTILLACANKDGTLARKAILEEQGYTVYAVFPSKTGIESSSPFSLAVIAVDSGDLAIDLVHIIRKRFGDVPIILVSRLVGILGLTDEDTGADAVIQKTATEPSNLVRLAKRLLNRKNSRKPCATQRAS